MPKLGYISRNDLIKNLRLLGFDGPIFSGGKHQCFRKGSLKIIIPNPHSSDIGLGLLNKILKQAEIAKEDWEKL